jgi:hypothetical protein
LVKGCIVRISVTNRLKWTMTMLSAASVMTIVSACGAGATADTATAQFVSTGTLELAQNPTQLLLSATAPNPGAGEGAQTLPATEQPGDGTFLPPATGVTGETGANATADATRFSGTALPTRGPGAATGGSGDPNTDANASQTGVIEANWAVQISEPNGTNAMSMPPGTASFAPTEGTDVGTGYTLIFAAEDGAPRLTFLLPADVQPGDYAVAASTGDGSAATPEGMGTTGTTSLGVVPVMLVGEEIAYSENVSGTLVIHSFSGGELPMISGSFAIVASAEEQGQQMNFNGTFEGIQYSDQSLSTPDTMGTLEATPAERSEPATGVGTF